MNSFWRNVDNCLDKVEKAVTVDGVMRILNHHFEPSSAEAFIGGSGGDRQVIDALRNAGWSFVWIEADYYFAARDKHGDILTYVEGDVYRGDQQL